MLQCYNCPDVPGKRECGRCRHVLKHELVEIILGMDRIYLTEATRNKNGRPSKIKDQLFRYRIAKSYKRTRSYRKTAEEMGIGKDSVAKVIKSYGSILDDLI